MNAFTTIAHFFRHTLLQEPLHSHRSRRERRRRRKELRRALAAAKHHRT